MPWSTAFDDPIPLPDGRELITLQDAAIYIQKLPKPQHDLPHWQHAVEHLLRASGSAAWLMFAHMFMLKALNHGRPAPPKTPQRNATKRFNVIGNEKAPRR